MARAAQGRDIAPTPPPVPAEPQDIETLEIKLRPQVARKAMQTRSKRIDPDDPVHFAMPTLKELEAQVRRRSVGRTIAEICLDLGIVPSACEGGFWFELSCALTDFGGSFEHVFAVRERRRQRFEKERSTMPNSWTFDWRDKPQDALRQLLGHLLGEPPPIPIAAS